MYPSWVSLGFPPLVIALLLLPLLLPLQGGLPPPPPPLGYSTPSYSFLGGDSGPFSSNSGTLASGSPPGELDLHLSPSFSSLYHLSSETGDPASPLSPSLETPSVSFSEDGPLSSSSSSISSVAPGSPDLNPQVSFNLLFAL